MGTVAVCSQLYAADQQHDSAATCTVSEFELLVCRVAKEKMLNAASASEPNAFALALDDFIRLTFVPTFRQALKRRGIVVPPAPAAESRGFL